MNHDSLAKLFLNPHLKYYRKYCEVECIRVLFFLLYSQHKLAKLEDNQPALEQVMQSQHESWEAQSCPLSNHHSLQHCISGQNFIYTLTLATHLACEPLEKTAASVLKLVLKFSVTSRK